MKDLKRPELTVIDKADVCGLFVLSGLCLIVFAFGVGEGPLFPFSLRVFIATFGLVLLIGGGGRLHQAAAGRSPFRDDTRKPL